MFQSSSEGASAPANFSLPAPNQETVRHILLGDYSALIAAINRMATLGYCDRVAWSKPIPTGRTGEVMAILTKQV